MGVIGRYIEEYWIKPHRQKLIEEGEAQGRAEARARVDAEWEEWLERHDRAARNGEPFNEPAPDERRPWSKGKAI